MNVDNIKPGTKLVWDAPEPFEGYAEKYTRITKKEGRVYYTCVATNRKSNNNLVHIQTAGNTFHWMSGEVEHLRLPTEDELNTLEFPDMKNYQ